MHDHMEVLVAMTADQSAEITRLRSHAEQLARGIEKLIRQRQPAHWSVNCVSRPDNRPLAPEDWSAKGCEDGCSVCLLNRALSIYRERA